MLAQLALEFENESAPCDAETSLQGEKFKDFVEKWLEKYIIVFVLTYQGDFTDDPNEIIWDQLVKNRFDEDIFLGNFN